jgi:replicative DNA helicase
MTDQVTLDKVPPHDEEAERCLLGSILLDHESCSDFISRLREGAFYLREHQQVFRAILQLYEEAKPVDTVLVNEQIRKDAEARRKDPKGAKEAVRDIPADYLVSLLESVPSAAHAEHYWNIVTEKATLREIISACSEILTECYRPSEESERLLDRAGELLLNLALNRVGSESTAIKDVLQETFDRIDALKRGEVSGLRTGFHELDQLTSGLQNSELVIIAGRPSMGKTSLAMNIAANVAMQHNATVGVFSLEVNRVQLAQNMLCSQARVNAHQVRRGNFSEEVLRRLHSAVGRLAECNIFIEDSPTLSIADFRAQCRKLKHRHGLAVAFVDYLQLMEGSRQRSFEGREKEISYISKGLKSIARELNVPVVALSQLSRAVESREGNRPRMSDLRESGSLEQDADVILMLYREGYYKQDPEDRSAEVIVAKQRNGPTGTVRLIFNQEHLRFENQSPEDMM